MQLETAFQNPQLCHSLLDRLNRALDGRSMRFMEVCGTHTVAIFQSGLRSLLPSSVTHLSGPGCPVCVTHDAEVAAVLTDAPIPAMAELAMRFHGIMVASYLNAIRITLIDPDIFMFGFSPSNAQQKH